VILVYIFGFINGREAERRQQTPAYYSQAAKTDAERACGGGETAAVFECVYEQVEASQEQARGEQDLSAQQRAATSALVSAALAFLTLVVTAVGVWLVKRTLDATLEAVEDTNIATKAMQRQNEMTAEAQRPWLKIMSSISLTLFKDGDDMLSFDSIEGDIPVQNFGRSPALNCRVQVAMFSNMNGFRVDDIYSFMRAEHQAHSISYAAIFPSEDAALTPPSYCPVRNPSDWATINSVEIADIEMAVMVSYKSADDPKIHYSADVFRLSLQETYNSHACRIEATSEKFGAQIS